MDAETPHDRRPDGPPYKTLAIGSQSLGSLLDRYRGYMRMLAERQMGTALCRRVDASDVVQQTMLEAHRAFADFRGASEPEFAAWLTQILDRNVRDNVRDHLQTAKRAATREEPLGHETVAWRASASDRSSPSQRAMRGEQAVRLAAALDQLPEDQRTAVRLRHLEGWSLVQIADHLNRTAAAAAGLIKRGMQSLRTRLENDTPL